MSYIVTVLCRAPHWGRGEPVEHVGVVGALELSSAAALGGVGGIGGVHGGEGVVARGVDERLDGEQAHVGLESVDLDLLGGDCRLGGRKGLLRFGLGTLRLGQSGLLAGDVGFEITQGPVDLGVGGLEQQWRR